MRPKEDTVVKRGIVFLLATGIGWLPFARATDFPFGAYVVINQADNPNYAQMKELGLNRLIMHVDDAPGSRIHVDSFKNAALKVIAFNEILDCSSIKGWPLLYSEALYSKWEAEDTTFLDEGVGIRHYLGTCGGWPCTLPPNVGRLDLNGTAWSVDTASDGVGRIQSGPLYYQIKKWLRQAQLVPGFVSDSFPRYTVNFRLRVDSIGGPDTICTISVTRISGAPPETTIVSRVLTGNSFTQAGQFQNFTMTYNFINQQQTPNLSRAATPNMSPSSCQYLPGHRDWARLLNFNIDWTKKRKLYVDYTEVYDELGDKLFGISNPVTKSQAIDSIKSSVLRLATQTDSLGQPVVLGWLMADEPSGNDFFLPIRFVDSLVRLYSDSALIPTQYGFTVMNHTGFLQGLHQIVKPKILATLSKDPIRP